MTLPGRKSATDSANPNRHARVPGATTGILRQIFQVTGDDIVLDRSPTSAKRLNLAQRSDIQSQRFETHRLKRGPHAFRELPETSRPRAMATGEEP